MTKLTITLFALGLVSSVVRGDEPVYELGGKFLPADGTEIIWTTKTEMKKGKYAVIQDVIPVEGTVEKSESRTLRILYKTSSERVLEVLDGLTTQVDEFAGKPDRKERKHPLIGKALSARLNEGKWLLLSTEAEADTVEVNRLQSKLNADVDLFAGVKAKVGDTWDIDPAVFVKATGYTDATAQGGGVKATLTNVRDDAGQKTAIVDLKIAVQATSKAYDGSQQSLTLQYDGTVERDLNSKLDRQIKFSGTLTVSGENEKPKSSYTWTTPLEYLSTRSVKAGIR